MPTSTSESPSIQTPGSEATGTVVDPQSLVTTDTITVAGAWIVVAAMMGDDQIIMQRMVGLSKAIWTKERDAQKYGRSGAQSARKLRRGERGVG